MDEWDVLWVFEATQRGGELASARSVLELLHRSGYALTPLEISGIRKKLVLFLQKPLETFLVQERINPSVNNQFYLKTARRIREKKKLLPKPKSLYRLQINVEQAMQRKGRGADWRERLQSFLRNPFHSGKKNDNLGYIVKAVALFPKRGLRRAVPYAIRELWQVFVSDPRLFQQAKFALAQRKAYFKARTDYRNHQYRIRELNHKLVRGHPELAQSLTGAKVKGFQILGRIRDIRRGYRRRR